MYTKKYKDVLYSSYLKMRHYRLVIKKQPVTVLSECF